MIRKDTSWSWRRAIVLLSALFALFLLAACGTQSTASPATQTLPATEVAIAPSATPTPKPSATPRPSATRTPTSTPQPSATASPTATEVPPSPTATEAPSAELDVPGLQTGVSAPTAAPAASRQSAVDPGQPVRLTIPSLGIDREPIPVGLDKNRVPIVPKHDVGWYIYSAMPGQGDNVVLWGHVLRWKDSPNIPAPFAALKDVQIGARIVVYTADGTAHTYQVSDIVWATPEQVEYILPTGSERLTLVSCIGDKVIVDGSLELSHRQITIAVPVD